MTDRQTTTLRSASFAAVYFRKSLCETTDRRSNELAMEDGGSQSQMTLGTQASLDNLR